MLLYDGRNAPNGQEVWFLGSTREKVQNTQKHRGPKVLYVYIYIYVNCFCLDKHSCIFIGWKSGKSSDLELGRWARRAMGSRYVWGRQPLGLANLPENARNFGWNFGQLQGLPCKSWYLKGLCLKWCQMFSWLSLAFSKTSKTIFWLRSCQIHRIYHVFLWVMYCCLYPSGPIHCTI